MTEQMLGRDDLIRLRPRANTVQTGRGRTSLVARNDGVVEIDDSMLGLYVYDVRVLGSYKWLLNGQEPEFSCSSNLDQHAWMGYFISPRRTVKIRRRGCAIRSRKRWSCGRRAQWAKACTRMYT